MLKMNIISKVEIEPISEEYIKGLILAEINKANPEVYVNSIEFVAKRNPARIEAEIDAQLGAPTEVKVVETTEPEVVEEEQISLIDELLDTPEPKEEAAQTVADIFSGE